MAGIGGFISNIFGSTNKSKAKGRQVDPNAYQYGGAPGGADAAANGYAAQGAAAQGRQAPQAEQVNGAARVSSPTVTVNYTQANADRVQGQQARQGQASLAQIMANRAQGLAGPSIAQQQADRQMGQAQAQQASLAGSARGAGALAAAQRNAAFNMANAASDISGQAQINAANERRDDTNAAAGTYSTLRGGDLASQGQDASQAQFRTQSLAQQNQFNTGLEANRNQFNAGLQVNQNQFNAGLRDAQAGRNDAYQQNYDALANQVRTTQLAAQMNGQAQQSANDLGAQGINAGVGGQNANMNQANAMNAIGMAQSAAGVAAGVGQKAKGGPTAGGKPYLVGEQGPELIIPQKDGYVLTADQTREALRGSPAATILGLMHDRPKQATGATLASIMGARAMGGNMPARADGGPVDAGGDAVSAGMAAPPPVTAPPGYEPPAVTWGTGSPDPGASAWSFAQDQSARMAPYDDLSARIAAQRAGLDATAARVNETVTGIDARDRDAIWNADHKERHGQSLSREEDDAATEARYRQSEDDKTKRADAKAKRQKTLASLLGDMGKGEQQAAQGVDTAYHGGGGHYVPPALIPIAGARAMGGPMVAGGLVPLGPQLGGQGGVGGGIEYGGGGISHNDLLRAGSGLASPQAVRGMVGGGGITGGSSMGGMAIPGVAGAREDGGPVEGSEDKQKRIYTYDASKPFGDRFVDSRARPPEVAVVAKPEFAPSHALRRMDPVSLEHSQQLATEMGAGPDAVRASVPWEEEEQPAPKLAPAPPPPEKLSEADEHKAAADETIQKAAIQTLLGGAGVPAPVAAAGIAHLINAYFSRRGGK